MKSRSLADSDQQAAPPVGRYVFAAILGIGIGFFLFNLGSLLNHTHTALSLSHQHKMTAFRAFVGLAEHDDAAPHTEVLKTTTTTATTQTAGNTATTQAAQTVRTQQAAQTTTIQQTAQQAAQQATQTTTTQQTAQQAAQQATQTTQAATQTQQAAQTTQQPKQADEARKLADWTAILSTRVCGSPAIDGYSHVVPKCLEESPTNKWWQQYYKSGGKQSELVVHIEEAADYDGLAVKWGLKNTVKSAQECAEQCLKHMPKTIPGPFTNLPCNAFAFCPDDVCFEPDAHHHTKGDCWLKFTEGPAWIEVNMRGILPDDYRKRHATAPAKVQWISGVLLPKGVKPTNGTWGPRWKW